MRRVLFQDNFQSSEYIDSLKEHEQLKEELVKMIF